MIFLTKCDNFRQQNGYRYRYWHDILLWTTLELETYSITCLCLILTCLLFHIFPLFLLKWAVTCDFQQCGILTSVDSDQPVQPAFRHRYSKWCSVRSLTLKEYSSDEQRLWSECAYAQADMRSLIWAFAGRTYHIVGNLMHWLKCQSKHYCQS